MRKHVCNLADSEVLDSRKDSMHDKAGRIYRKRKCGKCLNGFVTYEISKAELERYEKLNLLFAEMSAIAQNAEQGNMVYL